MNQFRYRLRFWRDHRWAPGHMSAYLDRELAPGALRRLERHLSQCHECPRLLAALALVLDALHRMPRPGGGDPSQITASVLVRLSEPPGP